MGRQRRQRWRREWQQQHFCDETTSWKWQRRYIMRKLERNKSPYKAGEAKWRNKKITQKNKWKSCRPSWFSSFASLTMKVGTSHSSLANRLIRGSYITFSLVDNCIELAQKWQNGDWFSAIFDEIQTIHPSALNTGANVVLHRPNLHWTSPHHHVIQASG